MLDFEGDVQSVYCYDFVATYEAFGEVRTVELKSGGASIPVTNENRQEFVNLYVDFVLNKSIESQFSSFAKGFMAVCGGNAIMLFKPQEIESLVVGSPEIDLTFLEAVTEYEVFRKDEPTVRLSLFKVYFRQTC